MAVRKLSEIPSLGFDLNKMVAELKSDVANESQNAGLKLVRLSNEFGVSVRDFLTLAVRPDDTGLNGYEQALFKLNLPVKNDFDNGLYLQAASDTFQTYAGTRALFPEVIDDVLRFAGRQDLVEVVEPMLANSRVINGPELLSTVVDNDLADGENDSFQVPELGRIPVRTIRTSQQSVSIFKHGSALRTSYEFQRRASIEIMRPHAARIQRELARSKVAAATTILLNGDGAYSAASTVTQSSFNASTGFTATNGKIHWQNFLYWLVQRAKAGTPVDTAAMNWDGYFQWLMLFGDNSANMGPNSAEQLKKMGVDVAVSGNLLRLLTAVTPVVSSTMPAGKLIGFTKGDTVEELKESGSDINETEKAILNQSITMTKTENTGYKLVYGDTRQVYNFAA